MTNNPIKNNEQRTEIESTQRKEMQVALKHMKCC